MRSTRPRPEVVAISEVLREAGVLLGVLPIADRILAPSPFQWSVCATPLIVGSIMVILGVYFVRGGDLR